MYGVFLKRGLIIKNGENEIIMKFLSVFVFFLVLFFMSCERKKQIEDSDIVYELKANNTELSLMISKYFEDVDAVKNRSFMKGDLLTEFKKGSNWLNLLKTRNFEKKDFQDMKKWILKNDYNSEMSISNNFEFYKSEIGSEMLINKVLLIQFQILMYLGQSDMKSFFQLDNVGFDLKVDTVSKEKEINLKLETKFFSSINNHFIVFQNDTIFGEDNVYNLIIQNPQKGENKVFISFNFCRWGKCDNFEKVPIVFYVK